MNASTNVLESLLEHESCDVDLRNRLHGDTPLHIAVRQKWEEHEGLRLHLGTPPIPSPLLADGQSSRYWTREQARRTSTLPWGRTEADAQHKESA